MEHDIEDTELDDDQELNKVTTALLESQDQTEISVEIVDVLLASTSDLLDKMEEYCAKGIDKLSSEEDKLRHLIAQELKTRAIDGRW